VLSDPELKGDALHQNAEGHVRLAGKDIQGIAVDWISRVEIASMRKSVVRNCDNDVVFQ